MKKIIYSILLLGFLSTKAFTQIEMQSLVFDNNNNYYVVNYYKGNSGTLFKGTIKTANNVKPIIKGSVTSLAEQHILNYEYKLVNLNLAAESLHEFSIYLPQKFENIAKPNSNWDNFFFPKRNIVSWAKVNGGITGIIPGDSLAGFSYQSFGLPSIKLSESKNYSWYSFPEEVDGPIGVLSVVLDSLMQQNKSVERLTIGPWLPDSTLGLEAFTDTLEVFRFRSCEELDWATDATVCGELENQLDEIKNSLSAEDSLSAANTLKDFLDLVEAEEETSLTSEGYALLYFNGKYLAERLPQPQDTGTGSGITCGCDNPVTQTSGTIAIGNGQTRCLNQSFSGSVFFQSGGTLNVCSTATFQNVYGNQPGVIQVSETGDVTVGNWNNNYSQDGFTNWGNTEFTNWTTINKGTLTNHGSMSISGGLNQNEGVLINHGELSVNNSVNLNKPGNQNTGEFSVGGTLTLNSNAELSNSCHVQVSQRLMINGLFQNSAGAYVTAAGQLMINSGGEVTMTGDDTMIEVDRVMLNGTVTTSGNNNLLAVTGQLNSNSGAAITAQGDPLQVCAANIANLHSGFDVVNGCQAIIPPSPCNPNGYGN